MARLFFILLFSSIGTFISAQTFSNVAQSVGIVDSFGLTSGCGGGISFCDFDGDGDDDLTFSTPGGEDIFFYENDNGTFTKIPSYVHNDDFTKQVLWVDYDNDGDKDFFLASFTGPNKLFQNDGNQNFTDVTTSVGIAPISDPTSGATFGDYDNDGHLDLYIQNFSAAGTYTNYMYHGDGAGGFDNETFSTNTALSVGPHFCALFFDYNLDGFQDIFIATDRLDYPNTLYQNNQNKKFNNVSAATGTNHQINAMNAGAGDYDNDGDLDLYVTNTATGSIGNIMLRNEYPLDTFADATASTGTIMNRTTWAGNFFDYDNDLDLDLYVSSFHVDATMPSAMFVNDGTGVFSEPLANGFPGDTVLSLCNVVGDYNNDGLMDIAVSHYDTFNFHLWKNENINSNNFLKVELEGVTSNRDGYGAMVELYIGANKYIRAKHCGEGYLGQNSDKLHFGLGTATNVDSLIVKWLGGNEDTYYNIVSNQTIFILEGASSPLPLELITFNGKKIYNNTNQLSWKTSAEINFKGYEVQRSTNGLTYEVLDFVAGKGGNLIENNYEYFDENLQEVRRYYYRLKMIDNDGQFRFSNVVVLKTSIEEKFRLNNTFPNPANDILTLSYSSKHSQNVSFKIVASTGSLIREWKESLLEEEGERKIDVKDIPQGNYFIIIEGNFPTIFSPFSVVK